MDRGAWWATVYGVTRESDATNTFTFIVCVLSHSVMSDSVTPWTVACQASLSMEFYRQENWSGLPFPPAGDLPDPVLKQILYC